MAGPDPHPTHQSYPSPHSMLGAWLDGHLHDVIVVRCVSPTPPSRAHPDPVWSAQQEKAVDRAGWDRWKRVVIIYIYMYEAWGVK